MTGAEILSPTGADARTRGLVFHDWFQQVGFIDEPGGVPADDTLRELGRWLAPAVGDTALAEWISDFQQALATPAIHEILIRNGATDLWRERAFALRANDGLLQGRLDRVAVWEGRALLVDFKTDAAGPTTQDHYRPQVDSYRRALCALLGMPAAAIEARLVFVATGDVVEMHPPQAY